MSVAEPLRRPFGLRAGSAAATKPAVARPAARPRPRLVLVAPARPTAGRLPFLILLGAVLVGGLLLLLMLHTLAAQDGFTINTLQQRLNTLTDNEQGLEQQVQADSAPAALRARASALGMVPSTVASYHKLHGGRAIGVQKPVFSPAPVTAPTTPSTGTTTKSAASSTAVATGTSTKSKPAATTSSAAAATTSASKTKTKPKTKTTATSTGSTTTSPHAGHRHHHGATAKQ